MKVGSLFSGIGGFDLAFERAGATILWQLENNPAASAVLAHHFPGVPNYGDISNVDASKLAAVDLVCGGFPCQDLSVAGRRAGLVGERSGLWFEFLRILTVLRPSWVVIENVPGLLSSHRGRDFAVLLRGLVELGYGVSWRILDAQFFGVAQRRRRVFIVGSLGNGRSAEVLFERESGPWDIAPSRETGAGVAPRAEDGAGNAGRGVTHSLRPEGFDASEDGTGRGTPIVVAGALGSSQGGPDDNSAQDDQLVPVVAQGMGHHHGRNDPNGDDLVVAAPFDLTQITSWANRQTIEPGRPSPTIHKAGGAHVILSNDGGNQGGFRTEPGEHLVVGTLAGSGAGSARPAGQANEADMLVVIAQNGSDIQITDKPGALTAGQARQTSGDLVVQSVAPTERDGGATAELGGDLATALRASQGGGDKPHVLAFTERTRAQGRTFEAQEEIAYALTNPGSGGRTHSRQVAGAFGVRRLSPTECERLQGFPDGWTAGQTDSGRYRQLGNAVAVPVLEWLARRIVALGTP